MLKKLFKYDWKSFWKVPAAINAFLIIITIIGIISLVSPVWKIESEFISVLLITAVTFYYIAIFAGSIAVTVFIAIRYYKSIYSDEGYLTNTLPVTARQIILSKMFISIIWTFITGVIVMISVLSLVFVAGISYGDFNIFTEIAAASNQISALLLRELGINMSFLIVFCIIYMIINTFFSAVMIFSAIALGQMFTRHKVAGAVIWYIVEYIIVSTVSSLLVNVPIFMTMPPFATGNISLAATVKTFMIGSLLISLVLCIILYFITEYMLSKKLNLE